MCFHYSYSLYNIVFDWMTARTFSAKELNKKMIELYNDYVDSSTNYQQKMDAIIPDTDNENEEEEEELSDSE